MAAEVCTSDELDARAAQVVREFAGGPTRALGRTRGTINHAPLTAIHDVVACEAGFQNELIESAEGAAAFLARCRPEFRSA